MELKEGMKIKLPEQIIFLAIDSNKYADEMRLIDLDIEKAKIKKNAREFVDLTVKHGQTKRKMIFAATKVREEVEKTMPEILEWNFHINMKTFEVEIKDNAVDSAQKYFDANGTCEGCGEDHSQGGEDRVEQLLKKLGIKIFRI